MKRISVPEECAVVYTEAFGELLVRLRVVVLEDKTESRRLANAQSREDVLESSSKTWYIVVRGFLP
jgi:hypothetical protein